MPVQHNFGMAKLAKLIVSKASRFVVGVNPPTVISKFEMTAYLDGEARHKPINRRVAALERKFSLTFFYLFIIRVFPFLSSKN